MKFKSSLAICLVAVGTLLVGCDSGSRQADSNQENSAQEKRSSHPKLSLHKPKTLSAAIQRLNQLHVALIGDGDFPAPIEIAYVEVIHGEGASGHSHFYSAASYDSNRNDDPHGGHHEENEKVSRHSMEVDARTELTDIARWLPKIAAKSNLDESNWNSVDSVSDRLTEIIDAIEKDASDASFRETWKSKADQVQSMLDELQAINDSSGAVK